MDKNNNISNKDHLRKILKLDRDNLDKKIIFDKSKIIYKKLINSKQYKKAKVIFCYMSFGSEIDTSLIIKDALKNKKLCIPAVKDNIMIPSLINDFNDLKKNKWGILEPVKINPLNKDLIDLTVVPGIAFNTLGYRLGYGGGYYDNFLKDYNGYSIGLVLKEFVIDELIPESHDVPVNDLIIQ